MKKPLSLILCVVMLYSLLPIGTFADVIPNISTDAIVSVDGTTTTYNVDLLDESQLPIPENTAQMNESSAFATQTDETINDSTIVDGETDNGLPSEIPAVYSDGYIDNTEYTEEEIQARSTGQLALLSSSPSDTYNSIVAPTAANITAHPSYSMAGKFDEYISPYSGEMSLKFTDLNLTGRNGLNFDISRLYQTNQSMFGDRKVNYIDGIGYIEEFSHSTYLQNRYNLGVGWSLGLPSVEVHGDESEPEAMYYHTGNGNVYKVNFGATRSNLENYYTENLKFSNDTNSDDFYNGQVYSRYYVKLLDGTCQYFAKDGRLIGIKDRFGNKIKYEHTLKAVSNIVPNGTFEYSENSGYWTRSNTNIGYNSGVMKFANNTSTSVSSTATSTYMNVTPNVEYMFSGWMKRGVSPLNTFTGYTRYTLKEFDVNKVQINSRDLGSGQNTNIYSDWVNSKQYITLTTNTRYVKIILEVSNAKGEMAFDNICFDRSYPLISRITDDAGRTAQFTYGDYVYDKFNVANPSLPLDGSVTVTMQSGSSTRIFKYKKAKLTYQNIKRINGVAVSEDIHCWVFTNQYEQGQLKQSYNYNETSANYEYFSFLNSTQASNHVYAEYRPLLKYIEMNNTKIEYDYSRTTKALGTGYYQTKRVVGKQEYQAKTVNGTSVWDSTPINQRAYGYVSNETAYPNAYTDTYEFSSTMSQNNGLQTRYIYCGNLLDRKDTKNIVTSEEILEEYFYDSYLKDMPSTILTTKTKPNCDTIVTYKDFEYEPWGGIFFETLPMTANERLNQKQKFKIVYDYQTSVIDSEVIYAIPKKKTWYNDISGSEVSEEVTFDSLGRATVYTNAKGDKTEFNYENSLYLWLPYRITQQDINNTNGLFNVSYIKEIPVYTNGIYPNLVYEYIDGIRCKQYYYYNSAYDTLKRYEDEYANETIYGYDDFGRLTGITYPATRGVTQDFVTSKGYQYNDKITVPEYSNKEFLEVIESTYKDSDVIGYNVKYYDDFGNLRFIKDRKVGTNYRTAKNDYDAYLNLTTATDFNGKYTTNQYDVFGRVTQSTNMANNSNIIQYGTNTVESYFVSNNVQENHTLEKVDIRGMKTESSIYPDGRQGTPITQYFNYNLVGNLKTYTDGEGHTTTFEYDKIGQLIKTKLPGTTNVQYNTTSYGKNGQPTFDRQIDGTNSNRTAVLYNSRYLPSLRMDSSSNSSTETETYTYDKRSKLFTKKDRKSNITNYLYDDFGNLKTSTIGTDEINLFYSGYGNVEEYTYTNHPIFKRDFDELGRTEIKYDKGIAASNQTGYRYDDMNNLKGVTDPYLFDVGYDYNDLNRLETVTADNKTFIYDYYPDGMLETLTYPTSDIKTDYTYDNANRVKTVITTKGATEIASFTYTYYDNNNIETVEDKNNAITTYYYDDQNRLLSVVYPTKTVVYSYDAFGNRQTETIGTAIKDYDYKGNVLSSVDNQNLTYDKNGNLLSDGEITYQYDDRNKLISSTKNGVTTTYTYNAEGLRTDKDNKWYHLDENGRVIAESTINNGVATLQAQTVWADKPLARKINGVYYYYIYNAHNDVVAVTDEAGDIKISYEYDAWGNVTSQDEVEGNGINNPIKYAGEYQDPETGLYYLRARYYDPKIGRFTQEDPIRDEKNWYIYCNNNPVNFIDPTGTKYYALRDIVDDVGMVIYWHGDTNTAVLSTGLFYSAMQGSTTFIDPTDNKMYIWVPDGESPYDYIFLPGNDTVTDEGWKIVVAAAGGTIIVKAGIAIAGALGEAATAKIAEKIVNADRVGSGLKDDLYHRAASYLSQEQLATGQTFILDGGTDKARTLLQVLGELNGKNGIFEYIIKNGQVTHQLFKEGGIINGIPN